MRTFVLAFGLLFFAQVSLAQDDAATAEQAEAVVNPKKVRPGYFVSSLILNPLTTGLTSTSDLNISAGMRLGPRGSLQFGLTYRDTLQENEGNDVDAGDPDEQKHDDLDELDQIQSQSLYVGYLFEVVKVARTGLRLGMLLDYGKSLSKSQDKTREYSENDAGDWDESVTISRTERSFYGLVLRSEVEHMFTPNIAAGIVQDFAYETNKSKTKEETNTRHYSGGVQSGTNDPSNTEKEGKGTDMQSRFQGIYLRVYF